MSIVVLAMPASNPREVVETRQKPRRATSRAKKPLKENCTPYRLQAEAMQNNMRHLSVILPKAKRLIRAVNRRVEDHNQPLGPNEPNQLKRFLCRCSSKTKAKSDKGSPRQTFLRRLVDLHQQQPTENLLTSESGRRMHTICGES